MYLFGLSQSKLTKLQIIWICFIYLTQIINADDLTSTDQKDSKLDNLSKLSDLDTIAESAKSIDHELLSKTGDDDKFNEQLKEILNAEESSVKEIKVDASTAIESKVEASSAESSSEIKAETKPDLKELNSQLANSTATTAADQLTSSSKEPVTPATGEKQADKIDDKSAVEKAESKESKSVVNIDKEEKIDNKTDKKDHLVDPLTSASSNVDIKNEEKKKDDVLDDKIENEKIESSKELEATHRESDSSELNIEESRNTENTHEQMRLVCYYANWAVYRPGLAKFTPQNINPKLCTHLIYAFAGLSSKYEIKAFDPYNDINQGNYKKFTGLKVYNKNLKTMIAIGGWNEASKRFSKLVADPELRKSFVDSVVRFLRQHQFDGLDLDWEYPAFREGSSEDDKDNYVKLIQELREAFEKESKETGKERLLLSIAVPAGQDYIDHGFDVPKIAKNVDFMNLLTYDYYTSYDPETGHHSPLSAHSGLSSFDDGKKLNVEWTVNYYLDKGAPRNKLVVGLPTYGRSYTLTDASNYALKAPTEGPGEQGIATREKGYLAYFEICQKIKEENWKVQNEYPKNLGPYAYKDKQWVGYDDIDTFIRKSEFIKQNGLGGGMIWTLDNDDFRGICNGQQSPLITALRDALFNSQPVNKKSVDNSLANSNMQPSSTQDKPIRTISRTENNVRKQIQNSRRPTFNFQNSQPSSSTTLQTTTSTTTTTTTTTTEAPQTETTTSSEPEFTTPDPGVDFKCEDEGFFKHPKDCKRYYWCLDSGPASLGIVAHSFTCPSGLFFNPQTEACDYPANVHGCKSEKKALKKKPQTSQKKPASSSKATEAPESTTRASTSTTQRNNNYNSNNNSLRRRTTTTTTTTTTQSPPTTKPNQEQAINQQITPELLAAALSLARQQEKSATPTSSSSSGPSDDHLFQLLQLVKSLGGVDKVQDLLNSYNYNKKPIVNQPIDFANPAPVADVHSHNRHLDSSLQDNGPITLLQPIGSNDYASPQRQNSRVINRQTTSSPFLNPSYVTPPRRQSEPLTNSSPIPDYSNQPIAENINNNNDLLDIPRNTQPRQRRPQRIESTTESLPVETATSRTRSPFSFVYNEPMLRNNLNPSAYDNVDESLIAITEPPRRNNRQRGRTASTSVVIEPVSQPIVDNVREPSSRPRIRGSNRVSNNNNVVREPVNNVREPTNVDGFFLYSQPPRSSRQPTISEPVREIEIKPRRNNQQNSRSRGTEGIGNSYSVPARVTSITNERSQNLPETAPSSSSTRKRKPAKVRIQTGFSVINETPASPGVTYDEEADIVIPFNEPRSNNVRSNSNNSRRKQQQNEANANRNAFTHHHSHNIGLEHHSLTGPNSIEIPSLNDSPPEPTIISRKPSQVRRRPPQRPHILNNPNILIETDYNNNININNHHHDNQPVGDLEEPIVHSNHLSTTSRGTTINPFSTYTGLSSIADIESTRINHGSSSVEPNHSNGPSIHSLVDDIESNYNLGNTDLSNYNNNNLNTSPVNNPSSLSRETNSNDLINTTPYLTTLTTEKSISPISESITTTPPSTSYASSSLATTAAPSSSLSPIRGSPLASNNAIRGGSRSRHRANANTRAFETTPQPVVPKRATSSLPAVTRSPAVVHQPVVTSAPPAAVSAPKSNKVASSGDSSASEPIVWDQATNKITCNKRGVHVHPQTCGQFVVCAPSKSQLKALVNHCPASQVFVKEIGRCKPGDRNTCKAFLKA